MPRFFRLLAVAVGLFPVVGYAAAPMLEQGAAAVSIDLQRRDSGTFYIPGTIQGYGEVELLVDTGSSFLVINEAMLIDLQKAGSASFSHELHGCMADGSATVVPVYRLAGVRLGTECWVQDVEAAVFPGTSRPILGMNILVRLAPFTFSTEPPQLALNQCRELPTAEFAELTVPAPPMTPAP
jgi:clan AA aspartic protease (TIGR02281 family)